MNHLVVLVLAVTLQSSFGEVCTDWSEKVDRWLHPLNQRLRSNNDNSIFVDQTGYDIFGSGFSWKGANISDFSTSKLSPKGAKLCDYGWQKRLRFEVNFDSLKAELEHLKVFASFIHLSNADATVELQGETLGVVLTEIKGETCEVKLETFGINNWGDLTVQLEGGITSKIVNFLVNNLLSRHIVKMLYDVGVAKSINTYARSVVEPHLQSYQSELCSLMNS